MLRLAGNNRSGSSFQDIKRDFSPAQLEAVGAVLLEWNELEFMLDNALYSGEELPAECLHEDLPRKVLDQKIDRFRKAAEMWELPADAVLSMKSSIDDFETLKAYRNAVAHSRIYDSPRCIGARITRKGVIEEVLLTTEALEWLYQQLKVLRREFACLIAIFDIVRNAAIGDSVQITRPGEVDPLPEVLQWVKEANMCRETRNQSGDAPSF